MPQSLETTMILRYRSAQQPQPTKFGPRVGSAAVSQLDQLLPGHGWRVMPSFFIRKFKVVRFISSLAAAP
jgi:hypothetical protein